MDEVKISVIVTIHNAEKYIKECLDSVMRQTFSEIEILCMDGGSTDATPQILQEYAAKDGRIRIINDRNTSYGHKVNEGIRQARGEYVSVLESDDMYEPFMLEKLYEVVEQYHPDFVNGDYTNFFDINGCRFRYVMRMYQKDDYNCLINYHNQPERFGIIPRYWTGIFRKEFLQRENIKMNESPGASFQDMSFRFLTSILSTSAYHLSMPLYLYRIDNLGSSMHDFKKTTEIMEEHEFLKQELLKRGITNHFVWHNAYQWKYTDLRGNMSLLKGKYWKELYDRYREEVEKDREILKRYEDMGYSQEVEEMIHRTPQEIEKLLEQDSRNAYEKQQQLYQLADIISGLNKEQKLVVFGCGCRGKMTIELLTSVGQNICCLTDNCERFWGNVIEGHEVLSPKDAQTKYPDAFYIVANQLHGEDIRRQLHNMGIYEKKIYVY